jgi:hypothetical protein
VRVTGSAQGGWEADQAALTVTGHASEPMSASGDAHISLSAALNGNTLSGALDVGWRSDSNGYPMLLVSNGVARLSKGVLERWKPEDIWWDGTDMHLDALDGVLTRRPPEGVTEGPAGWCGAVEGHATTGRQLAGLRGGRIGSVEVAGAGCTFRAEVAASAVAEFTAEVAMPSWSCGATPMLLGGHASATVSYAQGGPGNVGTGNLWVTARPSFRGLARPLDGLKFGPDGNVTLLLVSDQLAGRTRLSLNTEPTAQEFVWPLAGMTITGSLNVDATGNIDQGNEGTGRRPEPLSVRALCELIDVKIAGWGGAESNVVSVIAAAIDGGFKCGASNEIIEASTTLRASATVSAPPHLEYVPVACEGEVRWSSTRGHHVDVRCATEPFDLLGIHGIECRVTGVGVSNGVPVSVRGEAVARGSRAKAAVVVSQVRNSGSWDVVADVPRFVLDEQDDIQTLVKKYLPLKGVVLTGDVGGVVTLRGRTGGTSTTSVQVSATNGVAKADGWQVEGLAAGTELFLRQGRLRTTGEQSLRFGLTRVAGMEFDGGRVRWMLESDQVRVASAELDWLGGHLQAYALNFDLNSHDTAFVLYVDGIDVGRLLRLVKPLAGSGEGRLYGRMPVKLERGRWKLSTAYLYSMPGQEGSIRISDTRALEGLLMQAGVSKDVRETLADALRDFRFTTFALELHPPDADGGMLLAVRLLGVSRDPKKPTPVNATLNLRGPLETLLNMSVVLGQMQE